MAKQSVNIGTNANDGNGDLLRNAFDKINDNFVEIYNAFGDGDSLTVTEDGDGNLDIANNLNVAGNASVTGNTSLTGSLTVTGSTILNSETITIGDSTDGSTTVNGGSFTVNPNSTFAGTLGVTGATTMNGSLTVVGSALFSNSQVRAQAAGVSLRVDNDLQVDGHTHTAQGVQTITTTSGTINLDASTYGVFRLTSDLTGITYLNLQNMKDGQVIDITVSGSQTIHLQSDDTSETFNKVGGVDYDGASDNHIQVICIDATDSAAIYNYAIATYTSDTTP